jgi:hypothetical protein
MAAYRANQARRGIVPRQVDVPEVNAPVLAALAQLLRDGHSPREAFAILLATEDEWPKMSDARRGRLADAAAVLDAAYSPPTQTAEDGIAEAKDAPTKRATALQQLAEGLAQVAAVCTSTTNLATLCIEQAAKIDHLHADCSNWRERAEAAEKSLAGVRKESERLAPLQRLNQTTNGDLCRLAELHDGGYRLADLLLVAGGIDEKHVTTVREFMKILLDPSPLNRLGHAGMLAFNAKEQLLIPCQDPEKSAAA